MVNFGAPGRVPFKEPNYRIFLPAFQADPSGGEALAKVVKEESPIGYVTPSFSPMLLVHGDADELVPLQQSRAMDAALSKAWGRSPPT